MSHVFRIPKKKINLTNGELWELIVDATEQETQRRNGTGFSSKKGQQTIKTQLHINRRGIIKAVSASIPGNRHDKHLYDVGQTYAREPDHTPVQVKKHGDLGYVGTACAIPFKKPRSRPLMMHEKYFNRQQARHTTKRYNLIFRNIAGLRNFIATSS